MATSANPIKPRISLDDLAEFVEDVSPAQGSTSWDDSSQTIVYDVPFQYLYDAMLLLLGYAYTVPVVTVTGYTALKTKTGNSQLSSGSVPAAPPQITGSVTANLPIMTSDFQVVGLDLSQLSRNVPIYNLDGTPAGIVNWMMTGITSTLGRICLSQNFSATDAAKTVTIGRAIGAAVDTEQRLVMKRQLPAAHPIFPWMVCTRIDNWKGVGPRGKVTSVSRLPLSTIIRNVPQYTSRYSKLRLWATFTQPKYKLANDPDDFNEIKRYFWREQNPAADFITIDQGTMVFTEGNLVNGGPFTAPGYAQREVKNNFSYYWSHVPEEYICADPADLEAGEIGAPVRLLQFLGSVNIKNFLGHKPGTLLFDSMEYERYRMPLQFTDSQPQFWVRIKMNMQYFNPPVYVSPPAPNDRKLFGHQTAPIGPNLYAAIKTKNPNNPGFDGQPRYVMEDFNQIFYPLTADEREMNV